MLSNEDKIKRACEPLQHTFLWPLIIESSNIAAMLNGKDERLDDFNALCLNFETISLVKKGKVFDLM